jgi:hypothetical protein
METNGTKKRVKDMDNFSEEICGTCNLFNHRTYKCKGFHDMMVSPTD